MMMVDSAFIICYIMFYSDRHFSLRMNPMEKKTAWMVKVEQDLFLEDNQLPFFVINKLYGIAFGRAYTDISFKDLTCNFISQTYIPGREAARIVGREKVSDASHIKHLVDFLRICCLPPERNLGNSIVVDQNQEIVITQQRMCCLPPKHKNQNPDDLDHSEDSDQFPPSAKELKAAGIKFKATDGKNLLDIKYENGVLQIPTLTIQDTTESILRSLIFFEQCHHFSDSYFTDYVFFLDALIDTPEDVQILVQHGIIKHWLGSDDEVATMVNRMTRYITIYTPNFYYSQISRKLNQHAGTRWNKWRAILKRDYFNHPWSVVSVIYLVLLLILTVLQVYTGFRGLG